MSFLLIHCVVVVVVLFPPSLLQYLEDIKLIVAN